MDQVVDAQPLQDNSEVWKITIQNMKCESRTQKAFYVLASTGEVIGRPPESESPSGLQSASPIPTREDWSSYLSLRDGSESSLPPLFDLVRWQNGEEYQRGISKAWLSRIRTDPTAESKLKVARRYVLANVVPNRYVMLGSWINSPDSLTYRIVLAVAI